jgi:hypothetical protein
MISQLDEKIAEFTIKTGKEPTNIYLGQNEWDCFMAWEKEFCRYLYPLEGKDIPEYKGKQVFKVNADFHIKVA